jgi:uncharacterized membrane protein YdcZ (DUF606 family)
MMIPTQGAINTKLASYVESPVTAAFISFLVGTIALFFYLLIAETPLSNFTNSKNAPIIDRIFVTGKNWKKLFEIKVKPK